MKNGQDRKLFQFNFFIYFAVFLIIFILSTTVVSHLIFNGKSYISFTSNIFFHHRSSSSQNYVCTLYGDKWIVVTSILYPTAAIHRFLNLTTKWNLIIIGDKKTPKDWLTHVKFNSSRLLFLSIEQQSTLHYRILNYLPQNSYARKNLGYLIAIQCGARIIFESDDDNLLETDDIHFLPKIVQPKHVPWIGFHRKRSPFINIYGSFGHPEIWPRGFPVDELRNVTEDGWHSVRRNLESNIHAYIQQYLADLDPDVDAIASHPLSIGRVQFDQDQPPIALEPFTFSPYNTQNTVSYYEAFWGLYLPVTTTFRVCDIWRGFWVQRLLWDIGGRLVFGTATVKQVRNSHSYIKDMDEEDQIYHQSGSFVRFLSSWSSSHNSFVGRIAQLVRDIAQAGFWHSNEIDIIDAWLADLHSIGYVFPSIVSSSVPSHSSQKKRTAICVTGLAECIQEAWTPTYTNIRNHLHGEIDIFLFLSSSLKQGPVPLNTRLKQARSYGNSTVTILYEERVIDPHIPSNCTTFYDPPMLESKIVPYYQQLWGLAECFDLVKEYERSMNIHYDLFIRTRADSVLVKVPSTLEPPDNLTIIMPDESHYGGYNDRFAVGSISLMEKYMKRWHNISDCYTRNLLSEKFLQSTLDRLGIKVQPHRNLSFEEILHRQTNCH